MAAKLHVVSPWKEWQVWEELALEPGLEGSVRVYQTFKEAGRAREEVDIAFANVR